MKIRFNLVLFFLTFFVVMICSFGAVSAANDIQDIKAGDTNTFIEHPEANIQDSTIYNKLNGTDKIRIHQAAESGSITKSRINNELTTSDQLVIKQGYDDGTVQNSLIINNAKNSFFLGPGIVQGMYSEIVQGTGFASVKNSMISNAINNFTGLLLIEQGWVKLGNIENSMLNNVIDNYSGSSYITQSTQGAVKNSLINNVIKNYTGVSYSQQGVQRGNIQDSLINNALINSTGDFWFRQNIVDNSCLNNLAYEAGKKNRIIQQNISDSQICNTTISSKNTTINQGIDSDFNNLPITNCNLKSLVLFSENTKVQETNLTGVNGVVIAIGCQNYQKIIDNLTNTTFFNLVINNHVIFDFHL